MALTDVPVNRRSGSWTPTTSNNVNLDSDPTFLTANYGVVGNMVIFQLKFSIDATSGGGTLTTFDLTVPVAPVANFSGTDMATGVGSDEINGTVGRVDSVDATKTLQVRLASFSANAQIIGLTGQYNIA